MMIYNISNFPRFFETLDGCDEEVTLVMPNGQSYDWQTNKSLLVAWIQTVDVKKCNKMEIKSSDTQDTSRIMCYMLEGER